MDACSSGVNEDDRSSIKSEDDTLTIVGPFERTHAGGSPQRSDRARTLNPKRPSILRTKDSPKIWGTSLIPRRVPQHLDPFGIRLINPFVMFGQTVYGQHSNRRILGKPFPASEC